MLARRAVQIVDAVRACVASAIMDGRGIGGAGVGAAARSWAAFVVRGSEPMLQAGIARRARDRASRAFRDLPARGIVNVVMRELSAGGHHFSVLPFRCRIADAAVTDSGGQAGRGISSPGRTGVRMARHDRRSGGSSPGKQKSRVNDCVG
jgi:hypothetical protein